MIGITAQQIFFNFQISLSRLYFFNVIAQFKYTYLGIINIDLLNFCVIQNYFYSSYHKSLLFILLFLFFAQAIHN